MPNTLGVDMQDIVRSLPLPGMAADLPLRGMTVLAVEDSRFASEALRLMCRRLGARLRRAETLLAAQSHLRLYRPDVVIVDLGLPDGRGEALIREIVQARLPGPVILGTSGDAAGRASALAAGADGFLDKPLESFASFQAALLRHLPDFTADIGDEALPEPDPLALRDDLTRAVAVLEGDPDAPTQAYVAAFLAGVARHAHDLSLEQAAQSVGDAPMGGGVEALRGMVLRRLAAGDGAFGVQG